jgi:GAF domain-containing protein
MSLHIPVSISEQLDELLQKAIEYDSAKMGNIQFFDKESNTLTIITQKGFKSDFLKYFETVKPFDSSACGRAIGIGSPVLINDVMEDLGFIPHRAIAKSAGFRAVKSLPLLKGEDFLGVMSTHYELPRSQWDNILMKDVSSRVTEIIYKLFIDKKTLVHG